MKNNENQNILVYEKQKNKQTNAQKTGQDVRAGF